MVSKKALPKVLVGCPTSQHKSYCLETYADAVKGLTYGNYDVLLADNSKSDAYKKRLEQLGVDVVKTKHFKFARDSVIHGRNFLRERAVEKYDYFLSLEQDVIPPKNVIEKLLAKRKDIISGVTYHLFPVKESGKEFLRETPLLAMNSRKEPGKLVFLKTEQIRGISGIAKVDYVPMCCLLISGEVLSRIKFRHEFYQKPEHPEDVKWDDRCFCEDTSALGYRIYVDLGLKCEHKLLGGYNITLGDMKSVKRISE